MAFLYKADPARGAQWAKRFAQKAPDLPFHIWPDLGNPAAIRYLAAWQPPEDPTRTFPNLEVVFSVGAGIDPRTKPATTTPRTTSARPARLTAPVRSARSSRSPITSSRASTSRMRSLMSRTSARARSSLEPGGLPGGRREVTIPV